MSHSGIPGVYFHVDLLELDFLGRISVPPGSRCLFPSPDLVSFQLLFLQIFFFFALLPFYFSSEIPTRQMLFYLMEVTDFLFIFFFFSLLFLRLFLICLISFPVLYSAWLFSISLSSRSLICPSASSTCYLFHQMYF